MTRPVLAREAHVSQHVLPRGTHQLGELGEALPQGIGDLLSLGMSRLSAVLGEDGLEHRGPLRAAAWEDQSAFLIQCT